MICLLYIPSFNLTEERDADERPQSHLKCPFNLHHQRQINYPCRCVTLDLQVRRLRKWQLWGHFWIFESRKGIMALWNGQVAFSVMLLIGLQATAFSGASITDCSRLDSQRSLNMDQVSAASSDWIISRLLNIVEIEILTAVAVSSIKFWNVMFCSPVQADRRFGSTCCLYF